MEMRTTARPMVVNGFSLATAPLESIMATADQGTQSRISSDALDLLNCYISGLDKVVYEMAEALAKQRMGETLATGKPIRIDANDVKQAADLLMNAIRHMAQSDGAHQELVPAIEGMHQCLQAKCAAVTKDRPK
jgi:histone H3/H4